MNIPLPHNLLYMLFCFLFMDFVNQIQLLTFSTLADTLNVMNNHTLIAHYGLEPTSANIALLNSIITSSDTIGMLFSLFVLVPLAETKGRKFVVVYVRFVISVTSSICFLGSALYQASEFYIVGQIVSGLQMPLRAFVTMLFITECAPDKFRGFASTSLIFSHAIGQLAMYSIASPDVLGKANTWFIFPLFVMISSFVIVGLTARLPESPKWLVRQNRMEDAKKATEFYHGSDCPLTKTMENYVKEKNLTDEESISLKQIWENDTMREALKILISLLFFMVYDSQVVQGMYTVLLHQSAGFTVQEAMNINFILTLVFFPTKFIGTYIIDALGRRPVMGIAGVIVLSKSCLIAATQIVIFFAGSSLLTKIMYLGAQCLNDAIPATGVVNLGFLFISELFPPSARTAVAQMVIILTLAINFPFVALFPVLYSFFAPAFFIPPIFSQIFFGYYLYRHMPETRAKAVCDIIEDMDHEVASRRESMLEERTPLLRDRARTLTSKRGSLLNTARTRASTYNLN